LNLLISFPDEDEAKRWYNSPDYRELMKHRHNASDANVVLVTGRKKEA
jgi:uncharacterized protein (DUF1330 family)